MMTRQEMLEVLEIKFNGSFWHHYMLRTQYYDLIDAVQALIDFYEATNCPEVYGHRLGIAYHLHERLDLEYD